ncbi:unnamed protein product [Adineta ricciae]|uniref:V-SNARE coiled-coil homology domain-containing protein n=1 Tax=Adineta ricciae TaxID=249248 RepID=A0A815FJN1_ADIRI|nr:unnamed protein product [Adineta ricciae]
MAASGGSQANKLYVLPADVKKTTNVLKVTVEKLVERSIQLDMLNERADDLSSSSHHFHDSGRHVQQRMKCRYWKLSIAIILIVLVLIAFTVLMVVRPWKKKSF